MPRGQPTPVEFNSFIGGLNTEAGPLNFPLNASLSEINFVLNKDGSRQRRLGVDFELGAGFTEIDSNLYTTEVAVSSFVWDNAAGRGVSILVVQVGDTLHFFDNDLQSPSDGFISEYTVAGTDPQVRMSFSVISNFLVIANNTQSITVMTLNGALVPIQEVSYRLSVRDLWGVDDGVETGVRPLTLSNTHDYNLRNQGWPKRTKYTVNLEDTFFDDSVEVMKRYGGAYPSNGDIYPAFKTGSADEADAVNVLYPRLAYTLFFGTTTAPKGAFIIDPFLRGASRSSKSGISGLPIDATQGGISLTSVYSGRVFYAIKTTSETDTDGQSPRLGTLILFSKVVSSRGDIPKCHSDNDPTAEDLNQPLDTDGGFISIPDMGDVISMHAVSGSLFVFAENGVWEISGGEGVFSATNVSVSKVSNVGAIGQGSIVAAEGSIVYWSKGGIHSISIDAVSLKGAVTDLSKDTIQTLYLNIPLEGRLYATGVFIEGSRQVRWLFKDEAAPNKFFYNKELIFDLNFGAFFLNEIQRLPGDVDPYIFGYVTPPKSGLELVSDLVWTGATEEIVTSGPSSDPVTTLVYSSRGEISRIKFLTATKGDTPLTSEITVSEYNVDDFYDWKSVDGVGLDAEAYLLTGAFTGGESQRKKQVPFLTTHMKLTEQLMVQEDGGYDAINPSSCIVQARWEWTNNPTTGRWGNEFQVYRLSRFQIIPSVDAEESLNYGYNLVTTRSKLRGNGRSLSLYFKTEPGKDCHIYGWVLNATVNNSV